MFAVLDTLGAEAENPALQLAVWYHDAVYDSRASDNEERSAELARHELRSLNIAPDRNVSHPSQKGARAVRKGQKTSDGTQTSQGPLYKTPFSEGWLITRTADVIEETARLILLTKHHATAADDRVGQLLLDADLAILGRRRRFTIATRRPSGANMPGLTMLPTARAGRLSWTVFCNVHASISRLFCTTAISSKLTATWSESGKP